MVWYKTANIPILDSRKIVGQGDNRQLQINKAQIEKLQTWTKSSTNPCFIVTRSPKKRTSQQKRHLNLSNKECE